jgi:hypothetical protein
LLRGFRLPRQRLYLKSTLGHIARPHISAAGGERMVENGQAVRIKRLVNRRYQVVGYQMKQLLRADHSSPTAITCREMQANVGLASPGAMKAASAKVAEWDVLTKYFRGQMTVCA